MDNELYEASIQGNVTSFLKLLYEEPLIIHKYMTNPHRSETPLHISALLGHVDFVKEILTREPELASERNSEGSTALHLASARGHVEIVRCLLGVNVELCGLFDRYGMNPVHLAAVKGRVDALREMVQSRPDEARMVTRDGLTILHLCMIYNQLEAFKLLVEVNGLVDEVNVNSKDQDGNTVLHLAMLYKQPQIVELLEKSTSIDREARNANGLTASDMCLLYSNHIHMNEYKNSVVGIDQLLNNYIEPINAVIGRLDNVVLEQKERVRNSDKKRKNQQAENRRNALMIAATVIMSMSFQVALNPPRGIWQDDYTPPIDKQANGLASAPNANLLFYPHEAGQSVFGTKDPMNYNIFVVLNTVAFCGSTFVFLLLLSRLSFFTKNRYVIEGFNIALWLAILSAATCFVKTVQAIAPNGFQDATSYMTALVVIHLLLTMSSILFLGHFARLVWMGFKKCYRNSPPLPNH